MTSQVPGGQVSARRLARLLGDWRRPGARHGAADLAAGIRMLVLDGRLPPGTGLPPEREVAGALAVSRTMVAAAWQRLRADGMVRSRRGAGSWTALPHDQRAEQGQELAETGGELIDLARAVPRAMPGIAAAAEAVLPKLAAELAGGGYHERGVPQLRELLAQRYTARGLPTSADQLLITNGSHSALGITLRALAAPGDRVLLEQPTYPNAIEAVTAAHALPVPVALTDAGWDLAGIEAALRQAAPRLAYLLVDFQNPTGLRLDADGRQRLAGALRRSRTMAVVDETNVELDFIGDRVASPPPLAAFAEDWVITTGSASKSHWDGLRVGWVRAPREVLDLLVVARRGLDLGSPVLEQLILSELLTDGEDRLARRRAELAGQRDTLAAAMREHCPRWTFRPPHGGLALWCRLPAPVSTRIAVTAQNVGLRVVPGARFAVHGGLESWLRLPYTQPADVLTEAVRRLAHVTELVLPATGTGQVSDPALVPVT